MRDKITIEERWPFRIELQWAEEPDPDFSHYGKFCEVYDRERDRAQARNDPKGEDFYLRNPNAWRLEDIGNGTDSWVRVSKNNYGWFRLAEHPKHEVEYLMKEGRLTEREAWHQVLSRWNDLVEKLADGQLYHVWVGVQVFWNGEIVGEDSLGGIEIDEYLDEERMIDLAREHGVVEVALGMAQKKITKECGGMAA